MSHTTAVAATQQPFVDFNFFVDETKTILRSSSGLRDVLDVVDNILGYFPYFSTSKQTQDTAERIANELEPINLSLALPGFVDDLNDFRHAVVNFTEREGPVVTGELFDKTLKVTRSGAESFMFFDAIGAVPLKKSLESLEQVFWSAHFLVSGVELFKNVDQATALRKSIENEENPALREIQEDRLTLTYLNVVKNVTSIALASLILVSITFAAVLGYIAFSPVAALGLTSLGLILEFGTCYYEAAIDRREKAVCELSEMEQ